MLKGWSKKQPKQQEFYDSKVLIVVSKRNFKHAVDRNYIKRVLRECYRKNKTVLHDFLQQTDYTLHVSLNYVGRELPNYANLEKAVYHALEKVKYLCAKEDLLHENSSNNQ